jgi:hypothetical protein
MVPLGFQNVGPMQGYQPEMSRLKNSTITIGDLYGHNTNISQTLVTPRNNLNFGNAFYPEKSPTEVMMSTP